jgi:hypothetical protein
VALGDSVVLEDWDCDGLPVGDPEPLGDWVALGDTDWDGLLVSVPVSLGDCVALDVTDCEGVGEQTSFRALSSTPGKRPSDDHVAPPSLDTAELSAAPNWPTGRAVAAAALDEPLPSTKLQRRGAFV